MTVIRIEIKKKEPAFGKDKWEIRIGDIDGSTTHSNISKEEVLSEIRDEMQEFDLDANY